MPVIIREGQKNHPVGQMVMHVVEATAVGSAKTFPAVMVEEEGAWKFVLTEKETRKLIAELEQCLVYIERLKLGEKASFEKHDKALN